VHAALARPCDDPAFTPEKVDREHVAAWTESAIADLELAFDAMARRETWERETAAELARSLLTQRRELVRAVRKLKTAAGARLMTRVHGDFHLGQVLVAQGDAVIVDFEGEPARGLPERRAKTSPMKDVAGLLRSFDYAAAMLPMEGVIANVSMPERRQAALELWKQSATAAFLDAYRAVAREQSVPWVVAEGEQDVMDIFLIEKVAYEISYELANRPAWVQVPLSGLDRLARRLLS
jgi:maltose alpha-D-glucosyltransferase/alpha-amylase